MEGLGCVQYDFMLIFVSNKLKENMYDVWYEFRGVIVIKEIKI